MEKEDLVTVADGPLGEDGGSAPLYIVRASQGPGAGPSLMLDWSSRPSYLVGKSPLCDFRLGDPRVSRRHLSIAPQGPLLRVTDLGSSNGTRIGGLRVVEALLAGGEVIEIGDTQLKIARAPASAPVPSSGRRAFGRVLGASFEMQRLFELAEKLAASDLNVIIEGETGTGKELVAEAIHEAGPRAAAPLVFFDGAGTVEALDAAIANARGGTLVVSELSDLAAPQQTRLLPAVESGAVRVLATTRRDVEREVQEGRLREDLLFRLGGARLEVPPLRRRHGDVQLLAEHFWTLYGGEGEPSKVLLLKLQRSSWPGNVRELQNAVARAVSLGGEHFEESAMRVDPVAPAASPSGAIIESALALDLPLPRARQQVVREFERRYVELAMEKHGGNVTRAAAASGLTRRYFHILLSEVRGAKT
jgi:DNA-binding NtrC family response regulator